MKLRFFALAVIAAFCVLAIVPAVDAQPQPKLTYGDGNYVNPFANVRLWAGIQYKDEDASGAVDADGEAASDFDTVCTFEGGGIEMGLEIKNGPMFVKGSVNANFMTAEIVAPKSGNLDIAAFYTMANGLKIGWGNGADDEMQYKGDTGKLDTVADSGLRSFAEGGFTGMRLSLSYNGFFAAIFSKGYSPNSSYDATSDLNAVDYLIPRTVIGYKMPGPMGIGGAVGFQTKKIDGSDADYGDLNGKSIVSYFVDVNADIMMAPMEIHAHAFYNQNEGDMAGNPSGRYAVANEDGDDFMNVNQYGVNAAFAYSMGDITPAVGFGYQVTTADEWDDSYSYEVFARVGITMAPGCTFFPGINYTNGETYDIATDDVVKNGAAINVGVFFEEMM